MSGDHMTIRVECYAGYRIEETPRRFHLDGRTIEIEDVLDCWLAPDHRYFKVRGNDGCVYILRHDVTADRWEMTLFSRSDRESIKRSSTWGWLLYLIPVSIY